jgi:hypothetical protein
MTAASCIAAASSRSLPLPRAGAAVSRSFSSRRRTGSLAETSWDGLARQAAGDQLVAEFVVDIPVVAGRADVAEDELQSAADGSVPPVRGRVGVVAARVPELGDPIGRGLDLALDGHGQTEQAQVEGGLAAVGADLEHVVFVGQHLPGADRVGPLAKLGHDVQLRVARLGDHGFGGALAVGGPAGQGGDGEVEVLAGLDVGGDVPAAEHFGHVGELGEPGLLPEAVAAFGGLQARRSSEFAEVSDASRQRERAARRPCPGA